MGQRSRTETVAAVLVALLQRRVWSQAELARSVGVRTEALRKLLDELAANGLKLESEKDHPHVYWSVPATWFPGAVLFTRDDAPDLLRQLRRLPRSKVRDRLLATVKQQLSARSSPAVAPVVSRAVNEQEELYAPLVEDAAAKKQALSMRYLTASRNQVGQRHASVHLVDIGPPARFIATCHRNGDLRWFRVDSIIHARLDDHEPFRESSTGAVEAFRAASLDGYKGEGAAVPCSFFVRKPEADWVVNNLLEGMRTESMHDGIRVHIETSAVLRLARFVVGLGGAAVTESAALSEAVEDLARGALENMQGGAYPAERPAVPNARSHGPVQPPSDV